MKNAKRAVTDLRDDIDTTNDRTAWLAQSALALGPALTTVGAVAIPALAAMATQATVLVGAVGAGALAFVGMGDAVKALNDYQLEPTAANMEKLRQEFDKMGPSGAEFVQFLDEITPQLKDIQFAARDGLFPGMEDGITHLLDLLPQVEQIVRNISEGMGNLASDAGANLAGDGFTEFFNYLETDAQPILEDLGRTIGNFAQGFTHLITAFGPTTDEFSSGLLDMSRSFESWAENLENTQGFQEFIKYVEDATPKVLDLVAAFSDAAVQILEAAAPIGSVVVPGLTALLNVVAELADTPLGTMFLTVAAAMSTYGRAAALASITTGGMLGTVTKGYRDLGKTLVSEAPSAKKWGQYFEYMGQSAENASKKTLKARKAVYGYAREVAPGLAKAGAQVGLLGVIATGAAENMGLANTATLGLAGSLAGPMGAALGAGIGLFMDMRNATENAQKAQESYNDSVKGLDFSTALGNFQSLIDANSELIDDFHDTTGVGDLLSDTVTSLDFATSSRSIEGIANSSAAATQQLTNLTGVLGAVARANGDFIASASNGTQNLGYGNLEDLARIGTQVEPVLKELGYSIDDLMAMRPGSAESVAAIKAITDALSFKDSNSGRIKAVDDALDGLQNEMIGTTDSANVLKSALDALLSPQMNLSEATDAWTTGLRHLTDDLAKDSKGVALHTQTLEGNSDAAITNRAAIRDRVNAMMAVLGAEADAGASAQQLRRKLVEQRDALLNAGKAAGISKEEMRGYLKTLGLTPKLIETLINAKTDQALSKVKTLNAELSKVVSKTITLTVNRVGSALDGVLGGWGGGGDSKKKASGGYISGPGSGTSDSIPARLSNGEYVIKASSVQKYGTGLFDSLNAQRFANGGRVGDPNKDPFSPYLDGGRGPSHGGRPVIPDMSAYYKLLRQPLDSFWKKNINDFTKTLLANAKVLDKQLKGIAKLRDKEYEAVKKKLDAMKDELKALKDARNAYRDAVAGNFMNDPFGDNDLMTGFQNGTTPAGFMEAVKAYNDAHPQVVDPETGASIPQALTDQEMVQQFIDSLTESQLAAWQAQMGVGILGQDTADAKAMEAAMKKLADLGLSGDAYDALAQSGNVDAASYWASMQPEDIAALMAAFDKRGKAALGLGNTTADEKYAQDIRDQTKEVREQTRIVRRSHEQLRLANQQLRQMERRLAAVEKATSVTGPDRTAKGVANAVNKAATSVQRGK